MKIGFSLKDPNFLDYAIADLRKELEAAGKDEDEIDVIVDAFGEHFRYGEYLDLKYNTETDKLEFSK